MASGRPRAQGAGAKLYRGKVFRTRPAGRARSAGSHDPLRRRPAPRPHQFEGGPCHVVRGQRVSANFSAPLMVDAMDVMEFEDCELRATRVLRNGHQRFTSVRPDHLSETSSTAADAPVCDCGLSCEKTAAATAKGLTTKGKDPSRHLAKNQPSDPVCKNPYAACPEAPGVLLSP